MRRRANERKVILYTPLISIITTVLNGGRYLEICIQSVLSQSYPNIEQVFVDGGSSDGTLDLLTSYQARYPDRIRFISEPDGGCCDAWNKGWEIARGDIFGWLGADDTYEPDAVMAIVEFFRANLDAYIVAGTCNEINEVGEVIRKRRVKEFDLKDALNGCLDYLQAPAAFYKRKVIEEVGPMDPTINACDFDFFIKVGKAFHIYRMEKVLAGIRIHKDSIGCSAGINKILRREHFRIIRRHGGRIPSFYGVRYFTMEIIYWLRPVLDPVYPRLYNLYDGLRRRSRFADMLLGKFFPRYKD